MSDYWEDNIRLRKEIARLTRENDELLAACVFVGTELELMTTEKFRNGGDFAARQRLQKIIAKYANTEKDTG